MGIIIGFIVMGIMGIIAANKGFNPLLWMLAGGVPGFIILLCMPSGRSPEIDEETKIKRISNGNSTGASISAIIVMLIIGFILTIVNR